jgi:hypothetical protein
LGAVVVVGHLSLPMLSLLVVVVARAMEGAVEVLADFLLIILF